MSSPTLSSLTMQFGKAYGRAPTVIARAPGRIEFIGNHTDYNGGAVLGAAIDRYIWVAAAPGVGANSRIRLGSVGGSSGLDFPADPGTRLSGSASWANYPLGVWRSLRDLGLPQPAGFDLLVASDLPPGAGLSSSAALELATALALLHLAGKTDLPPDQLAALGRHAENNYVGVPCGILDQGTSAFGRAGHLVQIDCRGPHFSTVPLPPGVHFWIFNTREKHALIDGMYATRHRECLEAAVLLGVPRLTDLTPGQLTPSAGRLTPELARRARHIITEHARVHETVAALGRGDLPAVGRLLTASHRSSQLQFENSTPALDQLVDLLEKHPAVYGTRLTGGGFGGAVLAVTNAAFAEPDARALLGPYVAAHGGLPEILHLQSADGARVIFQ